MKRLTTSFFTLLEPRPEAEKDRESLPSLIRGFSITLITLLGYSAMAGTVGAGGLGDIAIRYGYQRYMVDMMIATIVILIVVVQVIQSVCDFAARKVDKKK